MAAPSADMALPAPGFGDALRRALRPIGLLRESRWA